MYVGERRCYIECNALDRASGILCRYVYIDIDILTRMEMAAITMRVDAYQCSIIQRRKVAMLSSESSSFLRVARGPLGSTSLHL